MTPLLDLGLILVASATICAALIVALRPLLERYALARPNARSSHRLPTPQGGGIAVILATVGVSAVASTVLPDFDPAGLWVIAAATGAIALIGALDDIRTIEVAPRLILQAILVGIVITVLPADLRIFEALPWWIERATLLIGGVWFVNLVNFMDGIDWMTVAETVPIVSGLAVLGLVGALPAHAIVIATALAGAVIGFAPFNRPVARLFLGDVGSLPIGLLIGWLLALLAGRGHLAAALLLPLYYLADGTITLLQRAMRRERVWEAHRSHFYQRAIEHGFTVTGVVARVFAVNLVLVALAAATIFIPTPLTDVAAFGLGVAVVAGLLAVLTRGKV